MAKKKTTERSERFETVRNHYRRGFWSEARVLKAVECGWITQAEADEILAEEA